MAATSSLTVWSIVGILPSCPRLLSFTLHCYHVYCSTSLIRKARIPLPHRHRRFLLQQSKTGRRLWPLQRRHLRRGAN